MVQEKATPTARRSGRTRKKNTRWEQDDKIGQRTKNTKTRRGRGGGRKKKKNKNEKIDEDVDNSTAADETEEEKLKPKKKKRKYTRRKKSSVIPRVTTTSSTGRIRKPSTKYVTYESSNDIHIPEQHQRSKQTHTDTRTRLWVVWTRRVRTRMRMRITTTRNERNVHIENVVPRTTENVLSIMMLQDGSRFLRVSVFYLQDTVI